MVGAIRDAPRRFAAVRGDAPDRSVVAVLFLVDRHLHKSYARAVRRNLGIADPVELKNIFLGDGPLLRDSEDSYYDAKQKREKTETTLHNRLLRDYLLYD